MAIDDVKKSLGRRLADIRSRLGLSQTELAGELGVSPRSYQSYERGERDAPTASLIELCQKFDIDPTWLLLGPDAKASLNEAILEGVLRAVDEYLQSIQGELPPEKKARLVKLLYMHFRDKQTVDKKRVTEFAELLLA